MRSGAMGGRLKTSLAWGASLLGATALARRRHTRRLRMLMYHGVLPRLDGPAAWGHLFITADAFARQMRHLAQAYQVLSLEQVIEALATGRPFRERAVAITFDDGYRQTLTTALPILRALRLPATVFVVSEMAGGKDLLWFDAVRLLIDACARRRRVVDLGHRVVIDGRSLPDAERVLAEVSHQIRALGSQPQAEVIAQLLAVCRQDRFVDEHQEFALAGWEGWRGAVAGGLVSVGSHGRWHGDLRAMSTDERAEDLQQSKQRIERELSRACLSVAYPYGTWNDAVAQAARAAGYACGFTTDEGSNHVGGDPFAMHRTMIGDKGDFHLFCARVSGLWEALRTAAAPPRMPAPASARAFPDVSGS